MRVKRRDRGAVAVMVSVSMITIFGFTALSIDLGNAWQNRRQLVNATDASALAAAQEYALLGTGCGPIANSYVASNHDDAMLTSCTPSMGALAGDTTGYVVVSAETTVSYAFAPLIGIDSTLVASTTAARYGIPIRVGGLRPFGLCWELLQTIPEFVAWRASGLPESDPVVIEYSKDSNPNACNGSDPVPGNWATIDLDGGANSNADIQYWTLEGFPGLLGSGSYAGDTGAFSPSLASELQWLQDSEIKFGIPLFQSATGEGANATFEIVGFMSVQLIDYNTSGSQENRSLTLKFVNATIEGECCDGGGIDTGQRVVQICALHPDDALDCETAAAS